MMIIDLCHKSKEKLSHLLPFELKFKLRNLESFALNDD